MNAKVLTVSDDLGGVFPLNTSPHNYSGMDAQFKRNARPIPAVEVHNHKRFARSIWTVYPQVKRATFYRYMKALREQHGYQRTREISPRETLSPGYEAQADFGQYKLKDM